MRFSRHCLVLCMSLVTVTIPSVESRAQTTNATVSGQIADPQGLPVPGVTVVLTNINTGVPYSTQTNDAGVYALPILPPGIYRANVTKDGFKSIVKSDIELHVQDQVSINFALQVGSVSESVTVEAAAPLLNTQNAVTGQVVDRTLINDLPLIGRGAFDLAFLAPGISQPAGRVMVAGSTNATNFVSNGSRNLTSEMLIDGVPATTHSADNQLRKAYFVPSIDSVQEFKVQQNNFSADIGFGGGTVVGVVLRSGTNDLHGSVYEFVRNDKFDANNWFSNKNGGLRSPLRYNDFGFTLGGPIRKDKTFYFANYEGTRQANPSTFAAGVPSATERKGDFGELCAAKGGTFDSAGLCSQSSGQLWDPYSGVFSPSQGGPVRSAFIPFNNMTTYQSPGNPKLIGTPYQLAAVPGNIIDPVALKMMQFFPLPNVGVGTAGYNPYNNWAGSGSSIFNDDQFNIKIDHRMSDSTLLGGRFSYDKSFIHNASCFRNALDPCTGGPVRPLAVSIALNGTRSISPTTVLTLSYGYLRQNTTSPGAAGDAPSFDPIKDLGLPSYMLASGAKSSPYVYLGDYNQVGADSLGAQGWSVEAIAHEQHTLMGSLGHTRGRHEMRVGGEMRVERDDYFQAGAPEGLMAFNRQGTASQPGPAANGGDAMATFLVGTDYSGWGEYEVPLRGATQSFSYSGYFQDNWRATDKLTLNLGLRYDLELPRTERHNRQEWFDPNLSYSLAGPGKPNLNVKGGEVFATPSHRYPVDPYKKEIQPRLGLAYRLNPRTVVRAGYGIFYNTSEYSPTGDFGYGFDGFSATTPWFTTYGNDGATPYGLMRSPWPGGPLLPTGNSLGPLTNVGEVSSGAIRANGWNITPYTQTWSLGFQRQLPGDVLIDANYVGTKGTHLYFGGFNNLNYLGPWVESATPGQITALNTRAPNPFSGYINDGGPLSSPTVPAWQLQVQFPQFTGVTPIEPPWANSIYHAFQLRVEKRFSRGLEFLASYTNSKSIDNASTYGSNTTYTGGFLHLQDPNNLKLERGLSEYDIPQVLQLSYVFQLPVGRGKQWGSNWGRWLDGFLGGWQTNGLWRFDNGQPIHLSLSGGKSLPTYGAQQPNLLAPLRRNTGPNWMDQYFANPQVLATPAPFTIGTAPALLPNVRAPGTNTAALSLFKEIPLGNVREGMRLEFRAEAFNTLNHPQFSAPKSQFGSGNFGRVTSQANRPRDVQLGLKLYF